MRRKPTHTRAQRICSAAPIVRAPRPAAVGLSPPGNDEGPTGANGQAFKEQSKSDDPKFTHRQTDAQHTPICAAWGVPVHSPNFATGDISVCNACSPHVDGDPGTLAILWACHDKGLTLAQAAHAAGFRPGVRR